MSQCPVNSDVPSATGSACITIGEVEGYGVCFRENGVVAQYLG